MVVRGNERLRDGEPINIGLENGEDSKPQSGSASPGKTSRTPPDATRQESGTSG